MEALYFQVLAKFVPVLENKEIAELSGSRCSMCVRVHASHVSGYGWAGLWWLGVRGPRMVGFEHYEHAGSRYILRSAYEELGARWLAIDGIIWRRINGLSAQNK